MARIRSIKPEIWEDEALAEVSTSARLLFIGLITQADDEGRLPGRTRWIASKIYPYDEDISPQDIEGWIEELDRVGLIRYYEVEGKPYIWLCSFGKHQSIDKRWRKESQYPPPPQEATPSARRAHAETSNQSEGSAQESASPDRIGEDRRGSDRKETSSAAAADPDPPIDPSVVGRGKLSTLLADAVASRDPSQKRPTIGKRWLDAERLLIESDGRDPDQAERLLLWSQRDEFWRANIRSLPKFRDRYGQLYDQARRKAGVQPGIDQAHRFAELARQAEAEEARAA